MLMTVKILIDKLGERVTGYSLPDGISGFSSIEYVLPQTRFVPGRAYVCDGLTDINPPPGCILLTAGPPADIPGCAVISCNGSAQAIYAAAINAVEDFQHFDRELVLSIETGCSIQQLVDLASDYIKNQLVVVDRSMQVIAFSLAEAVFPDEIWDYLRQFRRLPEQVIERMAPLYRQTKSTAKETRQRLEQGTELYGIPNVHVDLVSRGVYLGWLVLVANRTTISPGMLDIFENLALPFAHLMKVMHEENKPDLAFSEYFWQELLAGRLENQSLVKVMLKEKNWQASDRFRIFSVSSGASGAQAVFESILPGKVVLTESSALTIIERCSAEDNDQQNTSRQLQHLLDQYDLFAGVSDICADAKTLPCLKGQADFALQAGRDRQAGRITDYAEVAIEHLLGSPTERGLQNTYIHPAIRKMSSVTSAKARKNLRTLLIYLENERQLLPASEQLFIHRNTLLYRISRLKQEFDLQLDDPNERFRILLSIKLVMIAQF